MIRALNEVLPIQYLKNDGTLAAGGRLEFYENLSLTPTSVFAESTLVTDLGSTVTLDAAARWLSTEIWLPIPMRVRCYDAASNLLWQLDDVNLDTSAGSSITAGNLITNGSFEVDTNADNLPDSWTLSPYAGSTNVLDATSSADGAKSLKSTSAGNGGGTWTHDAYIEVDGLVPLAAFYSLKKQTAAARIIVQLLWYDAAKTQLGGGSASTTLYDDSTANPTSWTNFGNFVVPPTTARYCRPRVTLCDPSVVSSASAWIDAFVLMHIPTQVADVGLSAATVGGTGDAITATFTPAITALVDKLRVTVRAAAANTGAATLNPDGLGAVGIEKVVGGVSVALAAGDISGSGHELDLIYNASAAKWHLLNPAPAAEKSIFGDGSDGSATWTTSSKASGMYNFTDFNLAAGQTITVTGNNPLVIRCTGTATIAGTINHHAGFTGGPAVSLPAASPYPGVAGQGDQYLGLFGSGGGGGDKGAGAGSGAQGGAGGATRLLPGGAGADGGAAGAGSAYSTVIAKLLAYLLGAIGLHQCAAGGGSGGGQGAGGSTGAGGQGGGIIIIIARRFNFTGTLNADGTTGGSPSGCASGQCGGGGGGGGGEVVTAAETWVADTGTRSAAAGAGGSGSGAGRSGAAGGSGYTLKITL